MRSGPSSKTAEEFIREAIDKHSNFYDYSKVKYINCRTKIEIICPTHGVFEQSPKGHLSGNGCRRCISDKIVKTLRRSLESYLAVCAAKHKNFYIYDKVDYRGMEHNVIIECPIHGIFEQKAINHFKGSLCPACAQINRVIKSRDSFEDFLLKAINTHGYTYDYSLVEYIHGQSKIKIICKEHGIFEQTPNSHTQDTGCPQCKCFSKGERRIAEFLINWKLPFCYQKSFPNLRGESSRCPLRFDFYLTDHNLLIEFDGQRHFYPIPYWGGQAYFEKTQETDKRQNEYCRNKQIELIRISYKEDIETILKERLHLSV